MANKFDNIEVDIASLHEKSLSGNLSISPKVTRLSFLNKFLLRLGYYERFVDAGLVRFWFDEFSRYWTSNLGGRPLRLHDFFYLYSHYRAKFSDVSVAEGMTSEQALATWQRPENIYLTFYNSFKCALRPYTYKEFWKYLRGVQGGNVLEYGASAAPVITSLIRNGKTHFHFTAADIPAFAFHYSKYLLANEGVKFIDLVSNQPPTLPDKYDVIFLQATMEHLPNPLEVVTALRSSLNKGGMIIFDYILSEGTGLDTKESVNQRRPVLDFLVANFEFIYGKPEYEKSMGTAVVRLKN